MCVVFKRRVFLLTMLLFIFLAAEYVLADEAADITARCRFDATANSQNLKRILTDDYKYYWNAYQDGRITVTLPKGYSAQGDPTVILPPGYVGGSSGCFGGNHRMYPDTVPHAMDPFQETGGSF